MTIHIFDYDGVITSPVQDLVFQLPYDESETPIIDRALRHYNVAKDKDQTLNRYLALQAWILYNQIKTNFGPLFDTVVDLQSKGERWSVVSARAGMYPILNCLEFLQNYYLNPSEICFVGFGGKATQLQYFSNKWIEDQLIFYDDSDTHVNAARALNLPNLEIRKINVDMTLLDEAKALYARMQNDFS